MKKLTKRAVALMLMVAMLAAFMVPVSFASGTDPKTYEYDFRLHTMEGFTWNNTDGKGNVLATYSFGGTPHPQTNTNAISALMAADLGWKYPGMGDDGKADNYAVKNYGPSGGVYGGTHYSTGAENPWDGLRFASSAASTTGDSTAWVNFVIDAPTAGTYKLTYDSTSYVDTTSAASGVNLGVHIVPFTAEMDAKAADAPQDFNADVDGYVASGDYLVNETFTMTNANTVEVGEVTFGTGYDEYLVILSCQSAKRIYLDKLTFTEVAETAESVSDATWNFGKGSGSLNLLTSGNIDVLNANYATTGWQLLDYFSGTTNLTQNKDYIQQYAASAATPYFVFKLAAPEVSGTYDLSLAVYHARANGDHLKLDVYMAEYSNGMDLTTVPVEANYVGLFQSAAVSSTVGVQPAVEIGEFEFTADKEYVLYVKKNSAGANSPTNMYLASLNAEPQVTSVPKAQIGTTTYGTFAEAAAAATSGQTVEMLADYTGDIDLPAGVSLDLNGNTWTVSEYTAASAAEKIIDTEGTGVLKCDSLNLYGNNGGYMPLYDASKGGYTMNAYTVELDAVPETVGNAKRFWFNVAFADADALALLAGGASKMTIGTDVACGEASFDSAFVGEYEDAEAFAAAYATAKQANANIWVYIDVTGLDAQTGNTLTLTPTLELDGQEFELTNGNFTYNCQ